MLVWITRAVVLFAVLTVIYLALSLYNRWAERRRLAAEFDRRRAEHGGGAVGREAFVGEGMRAYERSLKRKLLLGVYLIPLGVIALLVVVAQFG